MTVTDNGPGIVRQQIPPIFAKLLYGSKFHRLRMSRGQQGIGISAAGMYAQLTTGKPVQIISRTGPRAAAHYFEVPIDTKKNEPRIFESKKIDWEQPRGTQVTLEIEGRYQKGRASVDEYLEQTAIANPHVELVYHTPDGDTREVSADDPRAAAPAAGDQAASVRHRVRRAAADAARHPEPLAGRFLAGDFSRVSPALAQEICKTAKLSPDARPRNVHGEDAEALYKAIQATKIMAPPSNCISPIGEKAILHGLYKQIKGEFYTAVTRPPAVYRGNPFVIEAGLAFGKAPDQAAAPEAPAVPLAEGEQRGRRRRAGPRHPLRQPRAAALPAVGLRDVQGGARDRLAELRRSRSRGARCPAGPMVVFVHMASVWVPFTSESKEAIADYDEIRKEIKLALQECGRRLGVFLRRRERAKSEFRRRNIFELYIEEVVEACAPPEGRQAGEGQAPRASSRRWPPKRTGGARTDEILGRDGGPDGLPHSIIVTPDGPEGEAPALPVVGPDGGRAAVDAAPEPSVRDAAPPTKRAAPRRRRRARRAAARRPRARAHGGQAEGAAREAREEVSDRRRERRREVARPWRKARRHRRGREEAGRRRGHGDRGRGSQQGPDAVHPRAQPGQRQLQREARHHRAGQAQAGAHVLQRGHGEEVHADRAGRRRAGRAAARRTSPPRSARSTTAPSTR